MKIILEGIDRLGKTTWADRICDLLGLGYYHPPRSNEPYSTFYERNRDLYQQALALDNTVHDRTLLSEYAYNLARGTEVVDDYRPGRDSLTFICVAGNRFIHDNHQDYDKEVPGGPQLTPKTALEYAFQVNVRYLFTYNRLFDRRHSAPVELIMVEDREEAWDKIQGCLRRHL